MFSNQQRINDPRLLQLFPNAVNQPARRVPNHRQQKCHNIDNRRHLSSLNRPSSRPTVVLISAIFWCICSTRSLSDLRSSLHSRSSAVNQIHIFPTAPLRTAPSAVITPRIISAEIFTAANLLMLLQLGRRANNPTASQRPESPTDTAETKTPEPSQRPRRSS